MHIAQLLGVLRRNGWAYFGWLMANLGGLIVAYAAVLTNYLIHREFGNLLPGPEIYLITGTISVAVAGVSYLSLSQSSPTTLSPVLSVSWAFLLAAAYGVLVALGAKPARISTFQLWSTMVAITAGCLAWSSLTWLHETGIRRDMMEEPRVPAEVHEELQRAAADLPRLPEEEGPEEGA